MYTRTPLDVVPTTRRHLDSEPLRTAHARTLCIATDTGATIPEARRALALGLRILRAQRREANAEPLHVRRWHGVGSQRCPSCQSVTGHAFWCDR